jgi:hypothetical protein
MDPNSTENEKYMNEDAPCCATYMSNIMHSLIINLGFVINRVTRHQ